jgi:hypothetical protein
MCLGEPSLSGCSWATQTPPTHGSHAAYADGGGFSAEAAAGAGLAAGAGPVPANPAAGAPGAPAHPVSEMAAEHRRAMALFLGVMPVARSIGYRV